MVKSKRYRIRNYRNWNHEIFAAIEDFIRSFNIAPHIILTNSDTTNKIDIAMSTEIVAEGLTDQFKRISQFACRIATLDFCLDNELRDKTFILIYDDDAELVSECFSDSLSMEGSIYGVNHRKY